MKLSSDTPVIISGGASGLGFAVAAALCAKNVPVGILDLNAEEGTKAATELGAEFAACDVSKSDSVAAALTDIRSKIGQERAAINCAGIAPAAKTVSRGAAHDPALFEKVIAVNLVGTFNLASQSALGMSAAEPITNTGERGVIINTASVASFEAQIGQIAYGASKGGVAAMTLPMARDLAKSGIRVVAIAPGIFKTAMLAGMPEEVQESLASNIPFPSKLGAPEDFASLAMHILENPYLNGEVIRLDGATRMQPR